MEGKLEIKNLHVEIEGKKILKGVNLEINLGEVAVLMGPNGSGKSTLANALMGHPKCRITRGQILFNGKDITKAAPDERARLGLFLSFQYPSEVSGVTVSNFLRTALGTLNEKNIPLREFNNLLEEKMGLLKMDTSFASRYLNEGFSGGEKKKAEILQLAMLQPKIAILDETDSGTDIDALKIIAKSVKRMIGKQNNMGALIITHYQRFLRHITPDKVHVIINGRIAKSGGQVLVEELMQEGYDKIIEEARIETQKKTGIDIVQ